MRQHPGGEAGMAVSVSLWGLLASSGQLFSKDHIWIAEIGGSVLWFSPEPGSPSG